MTAAATVECARPGCDRTFATERGARQHLRFCQHDEQAPDEPRYAGGDVEAKVRADVDQLVTGHPMGESLAEMAYTLARALDNAVEESAADIRSKAALAKELRATLVELAAMADPEDAGQGLADILSTPELTEDEPAEGDE